VRVLGRREVYGFESSVLAGSFLHMMKTAKVRKRSAGAKKAKAAAGSRFWVRKPNPELDRSGDWLLNNLKHFRREASTRADPI
jgi:hypothetical protein